MPSSIQSNLAAFRLAEGEPFGEKSFSEDAGGKGFFLFGWVLGGAEAGRGGGAVEGGFDPIPLGVSDHIFACSVGLRRRVIEVTLGWSAPFAKDVRAPRVRERVREHDRPVGVGVPEARVAGIAGRGEKVEAHNVALALGQVYREGDSVGPISNEPAAGLNSAWTEERGLAAVQGLDLRHDGVVRLVDAAKGKRSLAVGVVLPSWLDGVVVALQEASFQESVAQVVAVGEDRHYHASSVIHIVCEQVAHEGPV